METSNNNNSGDLEMGKSLKIQPLSTSTSSAIEVMEAAALLTLWSVLVINEGAIRFIASNPSQLDRGGNPSPYLLFLGGLFEVIFGIIGLGLGFSAFIVRKYSSALTKLAMVVQTLLGYYVFVIYVFVVPAIQASNLGAPRLEGLTLSQDKFIIALGVLTSFHFCLALQGGQFVFMARLVCAATGENFLKQKSGNTMRCIFWNVNLAMAGIWTLITGAIINSHVGSGRLPMPFVSPPNVGTLPGLTIVVGLVMICWGVVGILLGIIKKAPSVYFIGTGIVYILALLNFGIAQFGTFADRTAGGPIALHNGLSFMVVFMGPYFVLQAYKDNKSTE